MSAAAPPLCAPRWLTPDWPAPDAVRALSTWRGGGVSPPPYHSLNLAGHVEDAAAAVAANRQALRTAANLPAEPGWLTQVHGIRVADLDTPDAANAPEGQAPGAAANARAADAQTAADAAVTRHPGRVCAILTADCLPVLLAAESGEAVGAAHAGWRGLAAGVIESTVRALRIPGPRLLAWLGPAIGPEVRDALLAGDPQAQAAFQHNARGRIVADLYALARRRLARLGIDRVYGGGECTHTDAERYFSHRRDGRTGRQATLIWLEGPDHR